MAQRKHQRNHELEIDMDTRLAKLWSEADKIEEWNLELVGAFMRASYGMGYTDALVEVKDGEPQKLLVENGYQLVLGK